MPNIPKDYTKNIRKFQGEDKFPIKLSIALYPYSKDKDFIAKFAKT
jgi:hypothetical protein